jgi:hypothetical protein
MIFILLVLINIPLILLFRNKSRKYIIPVVIWCLIVLAFTLVRVYYSYEVSQVEASYKISAGERAYGDYNLYRKLEETKSLIHSLSITFIYLTCLQTLLAFVAQITGYFKTGKKGFYKWSFILFGVLTIAALVLLMGVSIVSTGGIIG